MRTERSDRRVVRLSGHRSDEKPWARRVAAVSLYVALFSLLAVGFLPLAVLAATVDAARGQPWTAVRALLFFLWYLACELVGVAASFVLWVAWRADRDDARWIARNYQLQHWWASMLGRVAFRIFGVRLLVTGDVPRFGERPVLLFVRHASVADTILAALLVSVPHGVRLRYVLKRELLWDPCLDIVGNRLPNVFVRRDSAASAREIAAIGELARGLGPRDGVLIYPEGTRFTPAKKARIVEKLLRDGKHDAAREAEELRHVLRPRSGGALALLEMAPQADVVFLAHTGFEGSASFDRFASGALVGATVHAELRAVPSERIPADRDGRRAWLQEQWRLVDEFVDRHAPERNGPSDRPACDGPRGRSS